MSTLGSLSVHDFHKGKFHTHSGIEIDIRNPVPQMIDIKDIAHALSNICRFGGHAEPFYSVAQHSVLVCLLAPSNMKAEALLHDAAEAYCGDVIKPLKVLLGETYECIEAGFMRAISARFGLNPEILAEIKPYDRMALELEHEWLIKKNPARYISVVEQANMIYPDILVSPNNTSPEIAYYCFEKAYNQCIDKYWNKYPGNLTWDMY